MTVESFKSVTSKHGDTESTEGSSQKTSPLVQLTTELYVRQDQIAAFWFDGAVKVQLISGQVHSAPLPPDTTWGDVRDKLLTRGFAGIYTYP